MKRKIGKRARLLAFLLAAIVMLTSFSFSSVYAEENQASDMVQKETNIDSPGEDTTEEDKEPEKDVEKDLETERQMKQLLKEIGVGFAESDAQANTSSMPRRAKATRAAGDVINTGRIKSNSIGRIDVIDYNDPSWPQLLTWREGLLGNTDTKEPLFCADPMDHFKAGKKTGVDASTIYNKETIQTVVAMMYYYDHYMCKSINSDYEYLMKQCAVWWVLNAVHGWFADGVNIETGNGVKCACGSWISGHKSEYYKKGLVWAWENYKYFTDAKGVIYQGNGQPLSSWSGTYTPKTYTSLTVQKVWDDQNNKYNLRPSSVKINLYRWSNKDSARVLVDSAYATPSNNDWNWKVTWNDLLRTDGDTIYDYTAQEEAVPGYTGKMSWEGSYEKGWVGKLTNTLQTGSANLQKTSAMSDITKNNDCYSLKGAEYSVYNNSSLSAASKVGTLITDENGNSNTLNLNVGDYYVKETTAPKGYALDKKVYPITIKPGETYTLKVSDNPTMDPVGVLLGKVDKETNLNKPEGSLPLEGALFTVKFYEGVQSDSDPAVEGKTADRTWIFRTNEDGFCYYEEKYLESGDELYLSPTKNPSLPIGTLTIQETKAPEGYLINPDIYTIKITSNNNGSEFVYTYNQPTIPEQSLDLNIVKKEKGKEYAIEGAVFEHVKPDGTTETVTTDANGVCKFKTLGYGQHKVREVSAPEEYTVNSGVVTFTVAKDNKITLDSNTAKDNSMQFEVEKEGTARLCVEDTLAPYQLKITKVNEKGKTLEGAEFTLYEDAEGTKVVSKIVTDNTGVVTTDPLEVEKKYYLKETKAPQGYRIPKDINGNDYVYEIYTKINDKRQYEYYVNGEVHTKDSGDYAIEGTPHERIVNLKVENHTGLQMPETGTHTTLLIVLLGVACMSVGIVHQFKKGRRKGNEKK